MSHLMIAIIHALLVFSLQEGNLSLAFAFPSKTTESRNLLQLNLFVPSTSAELKKSDNPRAFRNFLLSSFLSDGAKGEDLLYYLPNRGQDMPPDFLQLIRDATTRYSNPSSFPQGEDLGGIPYIVEMIDFEYKISSRRPVSVQNVTYTNLPNLTKLLSVCLFHQMPAPIVCELLREYNRRKDENKGNSKEPTDFEEKKAFQTCLRAMKNDGWKVISFPEGIRVQVRPGQVCSTWKDDLPPRKVTPEMADTLIQKAHLANNPPPPISLNESPQPGTSILTPEETSKPKWRRVSGKHKTSDSELALAATFPGKSLVIPFFPRDRDTAPNRIQERIRTILSNVQSKTQKLTEKLNQAGRAGFLAYGFLNLAVYAGGTLLQWRRIAVAGPPTMANQVQKLGKVLGTVYVTSQVTKLPRIALAVALAPVGNRSLEWLQDKLGVNEGTAFGILTAALFGSFFAVVGSLIVGSALLA